MRRALVFRRPRGEDGAIAIIVSLVFLFILLPASALGLTSYTRSGVLAEKARAADSGALAGAAALTLVNLAVLPPVANLQVPPNSATLALSRACIATTKAATVDDTLSSAFAVGPSGSTAPCTATYTPETSVRPVRRRDLQRATADPERHAAGHRRPGHPPLIPATTIGGGTTGAGSIYGIVRNLIPGLLHNGVSVTVNYRVSGPLDALLGQTGKQDTSTTSTARRRFKALLPDLGAAGIPGLSDPQAQLVAAVQALIIQLSAIVGDGADPNSVGAWLVRTSAGRHPSPASHCPGRSRGHPDRTLPPGSAGRTHRSPGRPQDPARPDAGPVRLLPAGGPRAQPEF